MHAGGVAHVQPRYTLHPTRYTPEAMHAGGVAHVQPRYTLHPTPYPPYLIS